MIIPRALILYLLPFLLHSAAVWAAELPVGSHPAALEAPYFPDRVHEFVFRNWTVVAPEKLGEVIGATADEVREVAVSMGLPESPSIPDAMGKRGYVSIIRRNWQLLPYDQLLTLLDMDAERLDVMLREEDFLWVKLGRLKPQCAPLQYAKPDEKARARALGIRGVLEEEFGDVLARLGEPRFAFVDELSAPLPSQFPLENEGDTIRIVHSYVAIFGDPLMEPELDPYPDGLLQRLASVGINGVWLHAVLRDLAPGGEAFPEFGAGWETRVANLRSMVDRAKRYGVDIYLYINEPRGMPEPFFEDRSDIAGVTSGELTALCTSAPAVRQWMGDALAHVFREVPDLGGIYAITASENLTNCASHGAWKACPRCGARTDTDIIAEVVSVLEEGVHRSAPDAAVLISDWGWRGHGDAPDMVAAMPSDITLMSVSEWNLPIERGGIASQVGEYSISAVGPGPRSQGHWKVARERGLRTGTEIQFNNTCEIASIPYLPVLDLVAEHVANLRPFDLNAYFIGWTMGGHPSPNFMVAERLSRSTSVMPEEALEAVALERYGRAGAPYALDAWRMMSAAFREYPFHISVVYTCPVQWGPANPLYLTDTGYSATMWGLPYDDLDGWRGPYPPEVFADQFDTLAEGWTRGLNRSAELVAATSGAHRDAATRDHRYGQAAYMHFKSVANQARFVMARDALAAGDGDPAVHKAAMRTAVVTELALAKGLYALTQQDSRIGFEPSCQYFYLPQDLVEKVVNCRWLLAELGE